MGIYSDQNLESNIQGFQDIMNSLDLLDDEVAITAHDKVYDGAKIIAEEQRNLAPVYDDRKRVRKDKKGNVIPNNRLKGAIKVKKISKELKTGKYTAQVGYDFKENPEAKHAIPLEFGRKEGVSEEGRKISYMDKRSHVKQGFKNKQNEALNMIANGLKEVFNK